MARHSASSKNSVIVPDRILIQCGSSDSCVTVATTCCGLCRSAPWHS